MKEQEDLKNGIGEIMRETTEMIEVPEEGMITEEGMEIGMRIEVTDGLRIGRREIEEVQVLGFAGRKEETEMMSVGEMMLKEGDRRGAGPGVRREEGRNRDDE